MFTTVLQGAELTGEKKSVKSVLENMDGIMNELMMVVGQIDEGIHGPEPQAKEEFQPDNSMMETVERQRDTLERILKKVIRIREGLW